jgi:hypothetical protein
LLVFHDDAPYVALVDEFMHLGHQVLPGNFEVFEHLVELVHEVILASCGGGVHWGVTEGTEKSEDKIHRRDAEAPRKKVLWSVPRLWRKNREKAYLKRGSS